MDYVLLTLLVSLGLVWARMIFMFAATQSGCAEQITSFGYVDSGWLAGQTIWSMLYQTTILATVFSFLIVTLQSRGRKTALLVFRIILLCGFILLALLFRSLVIEDPRPPDGLVLIDRYAEALTTWPISPGEALKFDSLESLYSDGRAVCVYVDRKFLIVPNRFIKRIDGSESASFWTVMEKGALIRQLQHHQTNVGLSDRDLDAVLTVLEVGIPLYRWRHNVRIDEAIFSDEN